MLNVNKNLERFITLQNNTFNSQILNGGGKILEDFLGNASIFKHSLEWTVALICVYLTILLD